MCLMWKIWEMPSKMWSTITHFVESSPPSTLSWGERGLSGLRWGRRGFTSSEKQVLFSRFHHKIWHKTTRFCLGAVAESFTETAQYLPGYKDENKEKELFGQEAIVLSGEWWGRTSEASQVGNDFVKSNHFDASRLNVELSLGIGLILLFVTFLF